MEPNDGIKIALILLLFVAVVFFFIISIAVALILRSRKNKRNDAAFNSIATTTGWVFSPSVPTGFKPFIDHIDKLLKPDRTLIGSPAANFFTGAVGGSAFAIFDYDYADSMSPGMSSGTRPNIIHQKGVLLTDTRVAVPPIEIRRKGGLRKAFEGFVGGQQPQPDFYRTSVSPPATRITSGHSPPRPRSRSFNSTPSHASSPVPTSSAFSSRETSPLRQIRT